MSGKDEAATTTGELREDERFVMTSIARDLSATWRPGENPPDAYLRLDAGTVGVEITTLTQYVTDDRGTRPRLSDDSATADFANAMNWAALAVRSNNPDQRQQHYDQLHSPRRYTVQESICRVHEPELERQHPRECDADSRGPHHNQSAKLCPSSRSRSSVAGTA